MDALPNCAMHLLPELPNAPHVANLKHNPSHNLQVSFSLHLLSIFLFINVEDSFLLTLPYPQPWRLLPSRPSRTSTPSSRATSPRARWPRSCSSWAFSCALTRTQASWSCSSRNGQRQVGKLRWDFALGLSPNLSEDGGRTVFFASALGKAWG